MNDKYYKLMINAYEKNAGIITSPDLGSCPDIVDGEEVIIKNDFIYELHDGKYCPYRLAPNIVRIVDKELKEILERYTESDHVRFFPVIVHSGKHGDRQYYIVHFNKIYDVIDEDKSVYGPAGNLIKLCISYNKVKGLHVFNSQPWINDIIVSTEVYKEILKKKLNFGTSFGVVKCNYDS